MTPTRSAFQVDPWLLRDVLAAVGFLFADELSDEAHDKLANPTDKTLDALNNLVALRREYERTRKAAFS